MKDISDPADPTGSKLFYVSHLHTPLLCTELF